MCVDLHYPTMRLMAKAQKNKGQLQVEVIYPDSDNPVFHTVGSLTAGAATSGWPATTCRSTPSAAAPRPASGG